jgi:CubicO group peptidase (beta-lactamase class C family)
MRQSHIHQLTITTFVLTLVQYMRPFYFILSLVVSSNAFSQNLFPEQDPNTFYRSVINKTDSLFNDYGFAAPGSAVVVIHHGNIILNKGYGLASLEHELAITPRTVFDLASISKMFTGYAIASLLQAKKISLTDDVRKYIPELPDYGHTITLDHLSHHTSGLRNWTEFLPVAGWSFDDVINFNQVLDLTLRQKELDFIPGSKYVYCNTGYVLLAEIVQRITGLSLKEWSQRNIFSPLAMTSTTILDDHTLVIPSKAQSYFNGGDGFQLSPASCSVPGSSSVHSSTEDLSKWLLFLDDPGDKKSVIDLMFQPGTLSNGQKVDYGLGVILKDFKGTNLKRHEGFWPSFSTYLFTIPEHHFSMAVLNNSPQQSYREILEIASMFVPNKNVDEHISTEPGPPLTPGISTKVFHSLIGIYRGGPAWYLTVTVNGSKLTCQPTNDDEKYEMLALSDSVFYVPEFRDTITFTRHHKETLSLRFKNKTHARVQPNQITVSQKKNLAGKYCNHELQTCYEIAFINEKIFLQHPHLGKFELIPGFNSDFTISGAERWFPAAMEFLNTSKKDASLKLGNYQFIKQE